MGAYKSQHLQSASWKPRRATVVGSMQRQEKQNVSLQAVEQEEICPLTGGLAFLLCSVLQLIG